MIDLFNLEALLACGFLVLFFVVIFLAAVLDLAFRRIRRLEQETLRLRVIENRRARPTPMYPHMNGYIEGTKKRSIA